MFTRNAMLCIAALVLSFPARPQIASADDANADLKAQAEALIENMKVRYRELAMYEDTVEASFDVVAGEDAGLMGAMAMPTQTFELALQAPNRIAFESQQLSIFCDGTTLWFHMPMMGQYLEREAPATWRDVLRTPEAAMLLSFIGHPVLQFLVDDKAGMPAMIGELHDVTAIELAEHEGVKATRITGAMAASQLMMMSTDPVPFEMWINDDTGLLLEARFDITDAYNAMMKDMAGMYSDEDDGEDDAESTPTLDKFVPVIRITSARINEDIPASRFNFDDKDSSDKVESFSIPGMGPTQQLRLVGNEAPDFTLPTLDDEELALSSLRGNVVLLDFWATWCGPCVQALPKMQEIHAHFKGQPVVVLGVNRDGPGMNDQITTLLERKDITFGHVLDADGSVAAEYQVTGIPSAILIDKDGIVQDVGMGFMPGKEKELIAKIDKLLKGERVYDADEVARQVAELGEEGEGSAAATFFQNPKESRELREAIVAELGETPDTLSNLDLPKGLGAQAWQLQLVDLEGDGQQVIVVPDGSSLRIASFDGTTSDRITLQGLPRASSIQFVQAIGHGEALRWVVTSMKMTMMGTGATISLSMHDRAGAELWTFTPSIPKDTNAHFGEITPADLDGDGCEEIALTFQAMRMNMSGSRETVHMPSAQSAHLLVFDQDGTLLAHEPADGIFSMLVTDGPNGKGQALLCATHRGPVWLQLANRDGAQHADH
jgi:peroxiredoxin